MLVCAMVAKPLAALMLLVRNELVLPSLLPAAALDSMPSRPPWVSEFLILFMVSCCQFDEPAEVAPNTALDVVLRLATDITHPTYGATVKKTCALANC